VHRYIGLGSKQQIIGCAGDGLGRLRTIGPQGVYGRRSDQARLAQPGQHGDRLVQAVQQPVAGQRPHAGRRQRLVGGGWRRRRRRRRGAAARQLVVVAVIASSDRPPLAGASRGPAAAFRPACVHSTCSECLAAASVYYETPGPARPAGRRADRCVHALEYREREREREISIYSTQERLAGRPAARRGTPSVIMQTISLLSRDRRRWAEPMMIT